MTKKVESAQAFRAGSKRAVAASIMDSNSTKSMSEVVGLISKDTGLNSSASASMYRWLVTNGHAKGKIEDLRKTKTSTKSSAKPKAKTALKDAAAKFKAKKSTNKTTETA